MKKLISVVAVLLVVAIVFWYARPFVGAPDVKVEKEDWNTNYKYVLCHGLAGWGSYNKHNKVLPYWGMLGGDLTRYLGKEGFDCYAASVAPMNSAWDRACELYAQLTGTRVDYGRAHSEAMGHSRYGEDFTGRALIESWSAKDKINLVGHSFGGATVRMLIHLLNVGDEAEQKATSEDEISGLFTGGKSDWVYSVVTLAAPHNGTSVYSKDDGVIEGAKEQSKFETYMSDKISKGLEEKMGDATWPSNDLAEYDMYIDNALELNKKLTLPENVYYFSYACSATEKNSDGTYSPVDGKIESMFTTAAESIGHFTGTTKGGFSINEAWQENDGLVNTISAKYPFGQPHKVYDKDKIEPGTWQVMPVYKGDHMSMIGGYFKTNDVRELYANLFDTINRIK